MSKEFWKSLGIKVTDELEIGFTGIAKPYRVDVTREADVIRRNPPGFMASRQVGIIENLILDYLAEHSVKDLN